MKYLAIAWNVLLAVIYVAVVIGILSAAESRFETLVLAGLIQIYAGVLYNFSLIGQNADINNQIGSDRSRSTSSPSGMSAIEEYLSSTAFITSS